MTPAAIDPDNMPILWAMVSSAMMDLFQLRSAFPLGAVAMVLGTLIFLACTSRRPAAASSLPSPKLPREPYTVYEEALGLHPVSEKTENPEEPANTP